MKLFTKKIEMPTFRYELANGTIGEGKGHDELSHLMMKHLGNNHENFFKWSWDGKEWYTMFPKTYDIYWTEGM